MNRIDPPRSGRLPAKRNDTLVQLLGAGGDADIMLPEKTQSLIRRVTHASMPPFFIVDDAGNLQYLNQPCAGCFGLSATDDVDDVPGFNRLLGEALTAKEQFLRGAELSETRITLKQSGVRRHFRVVFHPLEDDDGRIVAICAVLEDHSEVIKALELAIKTRARFSDVLRSISDWVWESDASHTITFLSERASAVLGHPAETLIGASVARIWSVAGRSRKSGIPAEMTRTAPFRNVAVDIADDQGRSRCHLISGVPVFDDDTGAFIGYRGTGTDVTAETEARSAVNKLSQAVDQSPISMMITDATGRIEYANPRFTALTGYAADEVLGRNFRQLGVPQMSEEDVQEMWQCARAGRIWQGEVDTQRKDGQPFWASVSMSPIRGSEDATTHFLFLAEDISGRKLMELEIVRARNLAEAANIAKSMFLANMSHEFRTPLNAIIGFSEIIRERAKDDERIAQFAEYAQDIHVSGQHLLDLVNEILDLSKIEAGRFTIAPEPIALQDECRAFLRVIQAEAAKRNHTLRLDLPEGKIVLVADRLGFRKIVLNLLSNAVKFTHRDGDIVLAARQDPDLSVEITVQDTGIGIPADQIERVMKPFEQIDSDYCRAEGGTGLGLALIKGLMDLHGGTVHVDSELDVGTRVVVRFPPQPPAEPGNALTQDTIV